MKYSFHSSFLSIRFIRKKNYNYPFKNFLIKIKKLRIKMNITKLSIKDVNKIKDMHILNIYRYSLKLIRTYPSIKRDELREILILGKFKH